MPSFSHSSIFIASLFSNTDRASSARELRIEQILPLVFHKIATHAKSELLLALDISVMEITDDGICTDLFTGTPVSVPLFADTLSKHAVQHAPLSESMTRKLEANGLFLAILTLLFSDGPVFAAFLCTDTNTKVSNYFYL